jgi:hypothetical protein
MAALTSPADRALNVLTAAAVALGAAGLAFALWQLLVVADSLSALWLVFWMLVFVPVFLALAAIRLWRAWRRGRAEGTEA